MSQLCDSALWYLIGPYSRGDKFLVVFYTSFPSALELILVPVFVRIYYSFLRIHIVESYSERPDKLVHHYAVPVCKLCQDTCSVFELQAFYLYVTFLTQTLVNWQTIPSAESMDTMQKVSVGFPWTPDLISLDSESPVSPNRNLRK